MKKQKPSIRKNKNKNRNPRAEEFNTEKKKKIQQKASIADQPSRSKNQ